MCRLCWPPFIYSNLHTSLVILFVVCIVQFAVIFHAIQIKNYSHRDSQLVEILQTIRNQSVILRGQADQSRDAMPSDRPLLTETTATSYRCDTIHVALVCAGYSSSRTVVTLLKSLLFYRHNPIHLHLIVDKTAHLILDNLLQTWAIPALNVQFYLTAPYSHRVAWIRNSHYSGKFGLMKLLIMDILPRTVSKVIVLDTDITLNSDIVELWSIFGKFNSKQAIGLVENQSKWYLFKFHWPAIGSGFNTGVMLMDLNKLRGYRWLMLWTKVTQAQLRIYNRTELADQDIFNAVFKSYPYLCYQLPCEWNVQLNDNAKSSQHCYGQGLEPKAIHWNAFRKDLLQTKHDAFFRKMYLTFVEYDGNLLRKDVLGCGSGKFSSSSPANWKKADPKVVDPCEDMKRASSLIYRTHLYFLPFNRTDKFTGIDVTFVTQLSIDRMLMLETLAMQWSGPISVAIYCTDSEAESLVDFVSTSTVLRQRHTIAYHMVYKDGSNSQAFYPVNYLRNVAMSHVTTDFMVLVDIDFVPKLKLREYLVEIIKNMTLQVDSKVALVLTPFETTLHRFILPITKRTLLTLWDNNLVQPFRFSMWKPGQFPVNYTRWRTATQPYEVTWTPYFEPYIAVSRTVPKFDTRFVGFGWNKVAHSMVLNAKQYRFVVLPEAFIVHLPHSPSMSNNKFRLDYHYRKCMHEVKREFIRELLRRSTTKK